LAVKIRLKRLGKIRAPYYRIVVADSKTKRDGRVIEEIGKYHPTEEPSFIEINSDRAQYWLGVGAQPTEQVAALLKLSGDWGKFKGDKNAKSTIRVAEPKPVFSIDDKKKPVLKPKVEKASKVEAPVEEAPAAEAEVAEVEVVEAPAAEETPAVTEAEAAVDEAVAEGAAADEAPAEGDDK
jgi:small subunit ribosomal protein S16